MKCIMLISTALLFFCVNLFAQAPDTTWTKIHDITLDIDEGNCIRQTVDGGYVITGSCVPEGLASHVDMLLLKTDPLGNIVWAKTYGRDFIESGFSVEQTADSGYIVGGRIVTGSYPFVDPPISDAWILKTDSNGDTLWTKILGGNGNDYCTSIQQTEDKGYVFTGTMNSEFSYPHYEVNEEYEPASSKAWLVKMDSAGDTLWTRTYIERSHGNSVIQTSDGGYVIAGWIFPDENDNQSDVLLIKTDSSGDVLWTKIIGGEDYDLGLCVRPTSDGYIIAGQTKPPGLPYDALLVKIDLDGKMLWSKTFGGEKSDVAFTVEVSDNGFFVTGTTNGTWWVTAEGDMWAFETDADGNLLWQSIYDIRFCDIAFCGIQSSDGGYVITGMTSHGLGGDLWLAKLAPQPSAIQEPPTSSLDFVLNQNYPNPFNPSTTISYSIAKPGFVVLKVYDLLGKEIQTLVKTLQNAGTYSVSFEANKLASGVYFYELKVGDDFTEIKKMLLVR